MASERSTELEVGIDVGATLAKVARCARGDTEPTSFDLLLSSDLQLIVDHVKQLAPVRLGITGGGATRLAMLLERDATQCSEFDAWAAGARVLLANGGGDGPKLARNEGFLLVSLGTGTSVVHVSKAGATRVGGTALGGGTVVGLGAALTGANFEDICQLAQDGSAGGVDLRVSDIYGPDEIPLAGDLTAANFGKFARHATTPNTANPLASTERADLAAGVMQLVGENVALICAGLAAATSSKKVIFGGTSLRSNTRLVDVLREVTVLCALEPHFLAHGEFAGAVGALTLASK